MPEKTSRTKKLLIEVARKLFAERGKKNVTMNDIAEASGKGRRTLYTYFKNKDEIYKAVIDSELIKIFSANSICFIRKNRTRYKAHQTYYQTFRCHKRNCNP